MQFKKVQGDLFDSKRSKPQEEALTNFKRMALVRNSWGTWLNWLEDFKEKLKQFQTDGVGWERLKYSV